MKLKMAACGVTGRRVILSFNFSYIFFQRHCVIVQSQKRCVIFSPRELQKQQNDVVESPNAKRLHSYNEYCLVSYMETILNTCLW